jgi:hypothetical protein
VIPCGVQVSSDQILYEWILTQRRHPVRQSSLQLPDSSLQLTHTVISRLLLEHAYKGLLHDRVSYSPYSHTFTLSATTHILTGQLYTKPLSTNTHVTTPHLQAITRPGWRRDTLALFLKGSTERATKGRRRGRRGRRGRRRGRSRRAIRSTATASWLRSRTSHR